MTDRYDLRRGVIHRAYAEAIYPSIEPGSVRLVISDGAYGMKKAAWDMVSIDGLADWYAPHVEAWGRLCAPSASVYLWNTAEGWARLDPVMRAAGWRFRCLIVWEKIGAHPARLTAASASAWPTVTEFCGMYQRGTPVHTNPPSASNVWALDFTNAMRGERLLSGNTVRRPGGHGRVYDCAEALHPCQKPLTFSDRMIRASSRPGDLVLEAFGGTCRVAVACERMPEPDARRYICIEPDEDGRDYIAAVLPSLRLELPDEGPDGQVGLFSRDTPGGSNDD